MMNLRPHRRIRVPDFLAVVAVVLLLASSAAGLKTHHDTVASGQETTISVNTEATGDDGTGMTVNKRRGLNLGLLLFRR